MMPMYESDQNVPVISGNYVLKRINSDSLKPLQRLAFDLAFPGFRGLTEPTVSQRESMARSLQKGIPTTWQRLPARRYAGDNTLPPGRYYTLVRNRSGDDGNTLVMELLAYHDPSRAGAIAVADMGRTEVVERLMGSSGQTFHALLLNFLSWPDQRSPIWDVAEQNGLLPDVERLQQRGVSNPDETYVPIMTPYELSDVTFTRVVDLRFYESQVWLVKRFGGSELERHMKNDVEWTAFDHFHEMLPGLLWAEPGGAMFEGLSQYVGHWMRTHEIEAFVYPSARNDPSVLVVNGEIKDHKGWNLIDYREAPPLAIDIMLNMTFFNSPTTLPEGVRIKVPSPDNAELRGTFAVEGLATWHVQRLNRPGAAGVLDMI
jgi:hypothetical protein